ncbi:MAG: RNA degradosome polyphosphate kinase [Epsilonproteobacteria bacterium]|nr:RNA degradosome polyphosphate kinase [Campylobacterota bacterium]MBD3839151.1 RNA degradosome polyphosphate kinase [Campylobacterota bacterium]
MLNNLTSPQCYFNRELSWLKFNTRVLAQAQDISLPPLERLKFIAIYGSNLDEFYMIRVAGLKALYRARIQKSSMDNMTPAKQLSQIREALHAQQQILDFTYNDIMTALEKESIRIKEFKHLSDDDKIVIKKEFFEKIYPILMPIAVDSMHPFPHLNNLSFGLALKFKDENAQIKYALIRIPRILPRFLSAGGCYVPIESIIDFFSSELFNGLKKIASTPFRVTRNADIDLNEDEADDFLEILEEGLRTRNRGEFVRLEVKTDSDNSLVEFLNVHMKLQEYDIYNYTIPLNLSGFWDIVKVPSLSHLTLPTYVPKILPPFSRYDNIFKAMDKQDILLYHPFESFDPVVKFIDQASKDPKVLAIRMTLYRVGKDSPIVKSLINSALNGKQVTVLMELKARFDEENNLHWAKALEEAGAHVVYGISKLKVHAKITQVVKQKENKLVSYIHLGTGNYNPSTARLYTDVSYFSAREKFGHDATNFFHYLSSFSQKNMLSILFMSPFGIKSKLLSMIETEAGYKEKGHIILKANALVCSDIIQALYVASSFGCKIDLLIRGVCVLKPKLESVSENISVYSIVGKYLEHPRIYYFKHDEYQTYISSADLMPRNLQRRVELMTPILDKKLSAKVQQILFLQLQDTQLRWELQSDGEYKKVLSEQKINSHNILEEYITKLYNLALKEKNKDDYSKLIKK